MKSKYRIMTLMGIIFAILVIRSHGLLRDVLIAVPIIIALCVLLLPGPTSKLIRAITADYGASHHPILKRNAVKRPTIPSTAYDVDALEAASRRLKDMVNNHGIPGFGLQTADFTNDDDGGAGAKARIESGARGERVPAGLLMSKGMPMTCPLSHSDASGE